jgi:two-component system, CAI-1 autoinducer sensor kinase/phosphatase CqsS
LTRFSLFTSCLRHSWWRRVKHEVFDPEVETILHLSPLRLNWLGIFTLTSHSLFWFLWTQVSPQPYENWGVRMLLVILGLGFFYPKLVGGSLNVGMRRYYSVLGWLHLPVFITWMYWMNAASTVWLATLASACVIYYQVTDWRLATLGVALGAMVASAIAYMLLGGLPQMPLDHILVILFAWLASIPLAISGANLRRERLRHSLVVIGVMAHELRTPLATASLIGQAMMNQAANPDEKTRTTEIRNLSKRLEGLTRSINHHIDLQMSNARFMQLPHTKQLLSAAGLVNRVVIQYPFGTKKEEGCIQIVAQEDFLFFGSERQFVQLLNNLLKNALYSLKAAQSRFNPGDLCVSYGCRAGLGTITLSDKGIGIDADNLPHIFEPFFSTSHDTGHGLGLAYCKQVIQSAGGQISVKSEYKSGATFTLELPVQTITSKNNSHHAVSSIPST